MGSESSGVGRLYGSRLLEFVAEQPFGHGGVAQCGVVGDAEDERHMQRVRALGLEENGDDFIDNNAWNDEG